MVDSEDVLSELTPTEVVVGMLVESIELDNVAMMRLTLSTLIHRKAAKAISIAMQMVKGFNLGSKVAEPFASMLSSLKTVAPSVAIVGWLINTARTQYFEGKRQREYFSVELDLAYAMMLASEMEIERTHGYHRDIDDISDRTFNVVGCAMIFDKDTMQLAEALADKGAVKERIVVRLPDGTERINYEFE